MTVYEAAVKRRTIRAFRQEPLPAGVLEKMLDAARLAPSGANIQPLEFVVVEEAGLLPAVFDTLKWAAYVAPRGNPPEGARPVAYVVVLGNRELKGGVTADAAAAIATMLLVGVENGVAGCWIGSVDRERLREVLAVPPAYHIDSVVALGRPAQASHLEPCGDSVEYWLDERGDFHVPKRSLAAVTHRDRFGRRGRP